MADFRNQCSRDTHALRKIERRGRYETAGRARSTIGSIFRYAIATGRADYDPTVDLRGALVTQLLYIAPHGLQVQPC